MVREEAHIQTHNLLSQMKPLRLPALYAVFQCYRALHYNSRVVVQYDLETAHDAGALGVQAVMQKMSTYIVLQGFRAIDL